MAIPAQQTNFSWNSVTCGPGANDVYRWSRFTTDGKNSAGPTGTWAASNTRTNSFSAGEGRTVSVTESAICRGLHADSTPISGSDTEVYTIFTSATPRLVANFPSDFWFDAIGTCPAGTLMQSAAGWTVGSGAAGAVGWGGPGGRSSGQRIENGNNTSYRAYGRCQSSYSGLTGPENVVAAYYGSTPSAPSVSVSRYSNVVGQWFNVYSNSTACSANGMGTEWYLGTTSNLLGRNRGSSASIADYWNSPGYYSYTGRIRCVDGAGNAGNASAPSSAGVSIYVPMPAAPCGVDLIAYRVDGKFLVTVCISGNNVQKVEYVADVRDETTGFWSGYIYGPYITACNPARTSDYCSPKTMRAGPHGLTLAPFSAIRLKVRTVNSYGSSGWVLTNTVTFS